MSGRRRHGKGASAWPAAMVLLVILPVACAGPPRHDGDAASPNSAAGGEVVKGESYMRRGSSDLADVALQVPLDETTGGPGRCRSPVRYGDRVVLAMHWTDAAGEVVRRVSVSFDAEGRIWSYNDLRAAMLQGPGRERSAPGTSINLTFPGEVATVGNQGGEAEVRHFVDFEEALGSRRLDVPRDRIRDLRERCAGKALDRLGRSTGD